MTKTVWMALGVSLAADPWTSVGSAPEAVLASGPLRARVYLPDAASGFYRGTRFDWSGMVGALEYAGHDYYPQWFQRTDSSVHDFVYAGAEIVASPCTAATGPAEEFSTNGKGLGFDEARPGGTFIKIGVGVLRRPDEKPYDPYRLYPIVDAGRWAVAPHPDAIEFTQTLTDPSTGFGYEYHKTVSLVGGTRQLVLDHRLRNTGSRAIQTSVYNHNFLYLDRQAPGPGVSLTFPFKLRVAEPEPSGLVQVRENRLDFVRRLTGEARVYLMIEGFGTNPADHDIRIESQALGMGVRITGDRPLARVALWAIRAPLSVEPFIDLAVGPGEAVTWRIKYEYFTLPK